MYCVAKSVLRRRFTAASILTFVAICASIVFYGHAYAAGTTVTATLYDSAPVSIAVTSPADGAVITSPTIPVTGTLHNVSQVMIYVDDVYNTTMPVDAGATHFSGALVVTPGVHTIKFVGIDPYAGSQAEQTLTINYAPSESPFSSPSLSQAQSQSVSGAVKDVLKQSSGAASGMQSQINRASSVGPMKSMTDGMYRFLLAVDLVSPMDASGPTRMIWRFILILIGLVLIVMPWSVYLVLRRLHCVPYIEVRIRKVTIPIRLLGAMLCILSFVLLS